jgi:hypothetical protein
MFTEMTHADSEPGLTISGLRVRPIEVIPKRAVQTAAGTIPGKSPRS